MIDHDPAPDPLPPQGQEPVVRVLAAVIRRAERYLVCLRPRHKRHGGYWEFPGGKIESGEALHDAAARELREELGVELASHGPRLFAHREFGSAFQIEFVSAEITGEPTALEHDQLRWATLEELQGLPLAPSDRNAVLHEVGERGSGRPFAPSSPSAATSATGAQSVVGPGSPVAENGKPARMGLMPLMMVLMPQ